MNTKQIIGLVVAAVLFITVGITGVVTQMVASKMITDTESSVDVLMTEVESGLVTGITAPLEDYVGVVSIVGTIEEEVSYTGIWATDVQSYKHTTTMNYIDEMMVDDYNQGLILYVDSPGGAVYESEEMYQKIMEYKEVTGRPVWTYMSHYATSGGYYISAASDVIYANTNTITGSIGVMISGYDMSGLYEKLGIEIYSITSGENKDSSQMTDSQMEIYQAIVDEYYERFVDVVEIGRDMSEEEVKTLADGRIYTSTQAKENGLIDEVGTYEEMLDVVYSDLGMVEIYTFDTSSTLFASVWSSIEEMIPKSESEILLDITEEFGSGVPMYYAEY